MANRNDEVARVEEALKQAYLRSRGEQLGQPWQDQVMRSVRRAAAAEKRSEGVFWGAAWAGALCSLLFFGYVFRDGIGLEYEVANLLIEGSGSAVEVLNPVKEHYE